MSNLAKVWPLCSGMQGLSHDGTPMALQPGVPGWMEMEDALAAQELGEVQLMAGQTPQSLKKPSYTTSHVRAEPPQEPDNRADEDTPPKEAPASHRKKKPLPRKSRTYQRADITAKKPGT